MMKNDERRKGEGEKEGSVVVVCCDVMYARGEANGIQNHHPASGLETNVFHAARQNA